MRRRIWRVIGLLLVLMLVWQALRLFIPDQERAWRSAFREALLNAFPEQAKQAQQRFGLHRVAEARSSGREVVLIHGLDDPGRVWMNIAPALEQAGMGVLLFDYPNDQPIEASAQMLRQVLHRQYVQGLDSIDLVAHSMGGLVAREMLTQGGDCGPACALPQVRLLVMIGTPNHGSELARFRALGEVREQMARLFDGQVDWLDWIADGAGEAGLDLIPGSDFLTRLNARPAPAGVHMVVIAGVIGEAGLQQMQAYWPQLKLDAAYLGDGLVSLDSARLPDTPLLRVEGNHLSIVRNVLESSERVPPAVPLVLGLLRR